MKTMLKGSRIHFLAIAVAAVGVLAMDSQARSEDAQPTTLRIAINGGPEGEAVKRLATEYAGATIELVPLPYESLREQLVTRLSDSDPDFDVVMIDDPWFPQLAANLKVLVDVPKPLLDDIVPSSLALGRQPYGTGELRALPFVGNTQVLFYRRDLLEKFGTQPVPQTWKDLAARAEQVTASSQKQLGHKAYGYAIRGRSGAPIVTDFLPIYWSLGGALVDDNGSPTAEAVNVAKLREALKIYKRLQASSPPGATNFDWSEMTAAFTRGQSLFELNWPAAIPTIETALKSQGGNAAWAVALPPGDAGSGTSMIGNWLLGVPADSRNPKAAEALIIWLMEQQGRVASSGNPPTRTTVFAQLAATPGSEYFAVIQKALATSTPRPRTERWAQIEDIVSRAVSGYLVGNLSDAEAANLMKQGIGQLFPQRKSE
jgi:multiple sugar transport system substrate-binding protein